MASSIVSSVGMVAAVVLPFWNIPLIVTIQCRRSSKDISRSWAFGVFICLVLMLPSGLQSSDLIFKVFSVMNVILFSAVLIQVVRFQR